MFIGELIGQVGRRRRRRRRRRPHFKYLLLRNYWANHSQISYGDPLDGGMNF